MFRIYYINCFMCKQMAWRSRSSEQNDTNSISLVSVGQSCIIAVVALWPGNVAYDEMKGSRARAKCRTFTLMPRHCLHTRLYRQTAGDISMPMSGTMQKWNLHWHRPRLTRVYNTDVITTRKCQIQNNSNMWLRTKDAIYNHDHNSVIVYFFYFSFPNWM